MFDVQLPVAQAKLPAGAAAPDTLNDPLRDSLSQGGGGQALPDEVQAKMGQSFQADLSGVRVDPSGLPSDSPASAMAHNGRLLFKPGAYNPRSPAGQQLIGHELAHLLQQDVGEAPPNGDGDPLLIDPGLEAGADAAGDAAAAGEPAGLSLGGQKPGGVDVAQGFWQVAFQALGKAVLSEGAQRGAASLAQDQLAAAVQALEGQMVQALQQALARPEVQAEIQRLAAVEGLKQATAQMVRELAQPMEDRARERLAQLKEHMPGLPEGIIANPFPGLTARVTETLQNSWIATAGGAAREAIVAMGAHSIAERLGAGAMRQGAAALQGHLAEAAAPITSAVQSSAEAAKGLASAAKAVAITRNPIQKAANYAVGAVADAALGPVPEVGAGVAEAFQSSAQGAVSQTTSEAAQGAAKGGSMLGPVIQGLMTARDFAGAEDAAGKTKALGGLGAAVGGAALAPVALGAAGVAAAPAVAVVGTAAAAGFVLKKISDGTVDYVSKHHGNKIKSAVKAVDTHAPVVSGAVRAAAHGVDAVGNTMNLAGSAALYPFRAALGYKQTVGDNWANVKHSAASAVGMGDALVPSHDEEEATPAEDVAPPESALPDYEEIDVDALPDLEPDDDVLDVIEPAAPAPESAAAPASAAAPKGMMGLGRFEPMGGVGGFAMGRMGPMGRMGGMGPMGPMGPMGAMGPMGRFGMFGPMGMGLPGPGPASGSSLGPAAMAVSGMGGMDLIDDEAPPASPASAGPASAEDSAAGPAAPRRDIQIEIDDSAAWASFYATLEAAGKK